MNCSHCGGSAEISQGSRPCPGVPVEAGAGFALGSFLLVMLVVVVLLVLLVVVVVALVALAVVVVDVVVVVMVVVDVEQAPHARGHATDSSCEPVAAPRSM